MNVRKKGHDYERKIAAMFRQCGFIKAKTTRETSKLLDNCKVDIDFIPFRVQCKSGYEKNRPKFDNLKKECTDLIKTYYPKEDVDNLLKKPYLLFHKLTRSEEIVAMDITTFKDFLVDYQFKKYCLNNNPEIVDNFNRFLQDETNK